MHSEEIHLSENEKSKTLTERHAVFPDHTVKIQTLYRHSREFKQNVFFFLLNYSRLALYFQPNTVCKLVAVYTCFIIQKNE